MQILVIVLFCLAAFGVMLFALHFSRYKKRKTGCCGGSDVCGSAAGNTCERHSGLGPGNSPNGEDCGCGAHHQHS